MRLVQVCDSEARAQRGAVGPVEVEQLEWSTLAQPPLDARVDILTSPCNAQPLALDCQKGDFIQRVHRPQARLNSRQSMILIR